ncbi:TPA: TA system toxin CbtA family protein, partial [Citrobacter freundii]
VEKHELSRIDRPQLSFMERSPLINSIDILRARRATGLLKRNGYKAVTEVTSGKVHCWGNQQ